MKTFIQITLALVTLVAVDAFAPTTVNSSTRQSSCPNTPLMAVVDINGEAAFDKTISSSGDSLVVVDYSTTW